MIEDAMTPSRILREIAASLPDGHALYAPLLQLANAFERQHNDQNNQIGVALGNAELGLQNQIDSVVVSLRQEIEQNRGRTADQFHEVGERLDTVDAREQKILGMLEELQEQVRKLMGTGP